MGEANGAGKYWLTIPGEVSQANALRRSLISDLTMLAPSHVRINVNTSCYSDEYLAKRLGLVPFSQTHKESSDIPCAYLRVQGRSAYSDDICTEDGPLPHCGRLLIMHMEQDQEIDLCIFFTVDAASTHARFMRTAAVGMRPTSMGTRVQFDALFGDEDAVRCIAEAIQHIRKRLDAAERIVVGTENQPAIPSRSKG